MDFIFNNILNEWKRNLEGDYCLGRRLVVGWCIYRIDLNNKGSDNGIDIEIIINRMLDGICFWNLIVLIIWWNKNINIKYRLNKI